MSEYAILKELTEADRQLTASRLQAKESIAAAATVFASRATADFTQRKRIDGYRFPISCCAWGLQDASGPGADLPSCRESCA